MEHGALLQSLVDCLGDGIAACDENGNPLFFNPEIRKILGEDIGTINPGSWPEHYGLFLPDKTTPFPPDDMPLVRALRGESPSRVEIFMRRGAAPGGTWISATARPLVDQQGNRRGAVAVFRNITERMRTIETFRGFLESAPDAMIIVDKVGNIVHVNAQTSKLFGYDRKELIGRPIEFLVPERFRNRHADHLLRYTDAPHFRPMGIGLDLYGRKKDGSEFPVEISLSPVETPDGPLFCSAIRDITDRKKAEAQLKAYSSELRDLNEKLEERVKERTAELQKTQEQFYQAQKMESLGTLAGGMAHDFGNLLALITLHADLALSKIDTSAPGRQDLAKIRQACDHANELVREVLLFSRRQTARFAPINLSEVAANLVKLLLGVIGEKYSLSTQLPAGLPVTHAHPGHVQQVLMNLILNARDAMPDGGQIVVASGDVRLAGADLARSPHARPGRFVRLSVADTGEGMDQETIRRIFDPFFTTKGPGKGTGLGLSVVDSVMKQHEGWVEVQSAPGRGSTFNLYFPVSES